MEMQQIARAYGEGKYIIWVDDKKTEALTQDYLRDHFVDVADSLGEAYQLCSVLRTKECEETGRVTTRYRITGNGVEEVISEDLDDEAAVAVFREIKRQSRSS